MGKKRRLLWLIVIVVLSMVCYMSCDSDSKTVSAKDDQTENNDGTDNNQNNGGDTSNNDGETNNNDDNDGDVTVHEDAGDYQWDSGDVVTIALNGSSITVNGEGAIAEGSILTISTAGTYSLSGSLSDGRIIVNSKEDGIVRLILNNADIRASNNAPIYIKNAEKAIIVLADNTNNFLTDGASYVFDKAGDDEPNAALFSKADMTIFGNGYLTVQGNYNDGIASKDGLIIKSGGISVRSVDDGIRGKDYLIVHDGSITLNVSGDGLKSDNDTNTALGYITIDKGTFVIASGGDAITAETNVTITDGAFTLTTAGGSSHTVSSGLSAKGIKGLAGVVIDAGTYTIDAADDGIHSNNSITINNGIFSIASGDDGLHADNMVSINKGEIGITKSYEGIEGATIIINDGDIHITASDDGINGAGGVDGSGTDGNPQWGGPGGRGGQGGVPGGQMLTGNFFLSITGGYIYANALGDGIDINGSIEMSGGTVVVNGPTSNNNGALDYDGSFKITGGFLVAAGSSGMAQAPGNTSTQNSLLANFTSTIKAGTICGIVDGSGNTILSFAPNRTYQSIAFSSPNLARGTTYTMYTGGSATGNLKDGLYTDGSYTPGTKYQSFTVNNVVTTVNASVPRF